MRATGGNDVNFAMDAPRMDSPDVADLRAKGAISLAFWAGPNDEPVLISIASAYEAATQHRKPPAAFRPVKGEPQ